MILHIISTFCTEPENMNSECTKLGFFGAKIAGILNYSIRMGKNVERFTNLRVILALRPPGREIRHNLPGQRLPIADQPH